MKTLLVIFGTRPEAIKVAPLILNLKKNPQLKVLVCSTGQHREMLQTLLQFFKITPDFDLDIMRPGQSLTSISSKVLTGVQAIVDQYKVDHILVQGDTTSSFVGGMVAFYNKIKVIHLEAGLRSNNIHSPYPEEFNRRALGLIVDLHLAPTEDAKNNLLREHVDPAKIHVTGNTGIDSLFTVRNTIEQEPALTEEFDSKFRFLNKNKKLILVTLHRRESFEKNIKTVMQSISELAAKRSDVEFLIPLHLNPEVRKNAAQILENKACWMKDIAQAKDHRVWLSEPLDYIPFVYLMDKCHFIITDSGGIQEEAPSLGKPVLIARENTERPEAIAAGTSRLAPLDMRGFIDAVTELLDNHDIYEQMSKAHNPFGDGRACERIEKLLL